MLVVYEEPSPAHPRAFTFEGIKGVIANQVIFFEIRPILTPSP